MFILRERKKGGTIHGIIGKLNFMQRVLEEFPAVSDEQDRVRKMVLESYHDIARGERRDYREFFDELEERYTGDSL